MRNLSISEADTVFGGQASSSQTTAGGSPGSTSSTSTETTSRNFTISATFDRNGNPTGARVSYSYSSGGTTPPGGGGGTSAGGMGGSGSASGNGIVYMDVIEINKPSDKSTSEDRLADLAGLY